MRSTYAPQLAKLVKTPPEGPHWLHELKYDGYRMGALIERGRVRLESRRNQDWTQAFPELTTELAKLPVKQALLDGEVVIVLKDGRTDFQALQNALSGQGRGGLIYMAFDLLALDGRDLRPLPLSARKQALQELLARHGSERLRYSEHFDVSGAAMLQSACKLRAEGIVSKRADQPYRAGRNEGWLKTKCVLRQEFVVGGFTDPEGTRVGIGSLLVGYYDRRKKLAFAGKVGTGPGFTAAYTAKLRRELAALEQSACPFDPRPPGSLGKNVHWTEPVRIAEVTFTEWTQGGSIRHPSLQGFRSDKRPTDVVREAPGEGPARSRRATSHAGPNRRGVTRG